MKNKSKISKFYRLLNIQIGIHYWFLLTRKLIRTIKVKKPYSILINSMMINLNRIMVVIINTIVHLLPLNYYNLNINKITMKTNKLEAINRINQILIVIKILQNKMSKIIKSHLKNNKKMKKKESKIFKNNLYIQNL